MICCCISNQHAGIPYQLAHMQVTHSREQWKLLLKGPITNAFVLRRASRDWPVLSVCRNSRFATRYGCTVAMPSPRISRNNSNLKNHSLVRFFAEMYFETETDYAENIRKSLIPEKVVCELYFQLVAVLEEFDYSV